MVVGRVGYAAFNASLFAFSSSQIFTDDQYSLMLAGTLFCFRDNLPQLNNKVGAGHNPSTYLTVNKKKYSFASQAAGPCFFVK